MELVSIEWPLIHEKEEIVHNERISLGQFIDTFTFVVEIDHLFKSKGADDAIDVNEYVHSDVDSVPEWFEAYINRGTKLRNIQYEYAPILLPILVVTLSKDRSTRRGLN
jgi:hypothetical protein